MGVHCAYTALPLRGHGALGAARLSVGGWLGLDSGRVEQDDRLEGVHIGAVWSVGVGVEGWGQEVDLVSGSGFAFEERHRTARAVTSVLVGDWSMGVRIRGRVGGPSAFVPCPWSPAPRSSPPRSSVPRSSPPRSSAPRSSPPRSSVPRSSPPRSSAPRSSPP
eukprot:scaffold32046_cov67-Phaeocystis_antarctica.AAC.1